MPYHIMLTTSAAVIAAVNAALNTAVINVARKSGDIHTSFGPFVFDITIMDDTLLAFWGSVFALLAALTAECFLACH